MNEALFNFLSWINSWVGSWGWAMVVFTILIRLALTPLDLRSRAGMRKTQKIQPKLAELQKKYANDKEKLNQKTMELYRKEHVSPTAGCLPMLISLPILWIMFSAMRTLGNEYTIQMILDMKATNTLPNLQSWLWIKNVFQPDSFAATILPAVGTNLQMIDRHGKINTWQILILTDHMLKVKIQYNINYTSGNGIETITNTYVRE